jgi:hypothetical protein
VEDEDIYILFSNLAEKVDKENETLKEVFKILIKTTLRYRDNLLKSKGIVTTVEDVSCALDWLVPAMKTGRLPLTDNKIRLDLLKLWLDELKSIAGPLL